jgi:DNA polymerase III subunit delta
VYFLQGEETYFIDQFAGYIERHALQESEKSFNQVVLYGRDVNVAAILTHARRFPMMADRQVVIVKEAQGILDLQNEAGSKLMLTYLANPVPSTILVFCYMHKTLDKRRELGKQAEKRATVLTFKRIYENQLPDFISDYVAGRGYRIEDNAIRVLADYVGNDLSRLANEIEKVLMEVSKETVITAAKVMAMVGISKEYNVFELQRALVDRDVLSTTRIVNYFVSNTKRNPPIPMVAYLYSFFSKLLIAVSLGDVNERSLISTLKISPFSAKDYSKASRKFSREKVVENLSLLKQADLKLKGVDSGSASEGDIVKELIHRLI